MDAGNIRTALVVGAGLMGHGIAQVFATAGVRVHLVDLDEQVIDGALRRMEGNLDLLAESGRMAREAIPEILGRIHPFTDLSEAAASVDFAIEAVAERADVKKELFSNLDALCPERAVLASNTSSLDIFHFAKVRNPGRLVVCHWFAPAHIIPLVEVVPGEETAPEVVELAVAFLKRVGKHPLAMKGFVPAFIVNRIQISMSQAIWEMLENGWATPEEIDQAVKMTLGIRLPIVGVAQSQDFTGLDVVRDIMNAQGKASRVVEAKVREGRLGAKTSGGLFDYQGRSEAEILRKRDERYLRMLDHLEKAGAFEPI